MKTFVVFTLLVAAVAAVTAAPLSADAEAVILRSDNDNIGLGPFSYAYESSNGIAAQAQGELLNQGSENQALVMRGSYSYTGPDGLVYSVTYTADENGFHPHGAHIPVA